MKAPARLALYGAGLVVAFGGAFGLAGIAVPDSAVQTWTEESEMDAHNGGADEMSTHSEGQHESGGMAGHDHAPDGGAPPEGIEAAADPTYPVGTTVRLTADHMPGMDGAEATISGAFTTTTYSVSYTPTTGGEPVHNHKWVVHEELQNPGPASLANGTTVVLQADHMTGMSGAKARIDSSTQETVYMVDLKTDGMTMTNHKWVVESEIQPVR
ncbi:YdhK family protein [Rhodococcus pyridinivorans]|uniref:YdhK family protein n=1 Tax=Rhodococcus pyridinivorans TaxID=103816 RepID=UPI0020787D64|nr:YdhK family protein [Rhodococcus pyridinivorans]USI92971.1 YdhK family protein [Rhodococcus pyridinivorans]